MKAAALAVPLLLLVASCSGEADDPTVVPPSATPSAAGTSAPPSPTAAPTRSPAPSPTPSPTPSRVVPAAEGDVDGDGTKDTAFATDTLLTVRLSGEQRAVTAPVHAENPGSPDVLGTADVDRDGRAEVFLRTVEGASTGFATPYRYDGKTLSEVQLDGGPARLGFGGSVTHGDGFRCLPTGQVEIRSATSQDGETFDVEVRVYVLKGAVLTLQSTRTAKAKQGSPTVAASYTADCGSVSG